MGLSLKDQLLAAGLLTEKQAKQSGKEKHQQRKEQGKKPPAVDPRALAAQKAAEEKAARDRELNLKLQEEAARKARKAEIKQLIEQNRVPRVEGEDLYNFVDGKRIRRLAMDRPMRDRLVAGTLTIVKFEGRYEVVPTDVAGKIRERNEHLVIARPTETAGGAATSGEDDPYKDYKVPDDLMW